MNRFPTLKNEINISFRKLSKHVKITAGVLNKLCEEKRPFRQCHIVPLTAFFDCTSDYLLGNTDAGVYVYLKYSYHGIDRILLTEKQYEELMPHINVSIVNTHMPPVTMVIGNKELYMPTSVVYRELDNSNDLPVITKTLLLAVIENLDEEKLKKVKDLINIVL